MVKRSNSDIDAFVSQLAAISLDALISQAFVCRELMDEEEDHFRVDEYRKQLAAVEAIGKLRFGVDYEDAFAQQAAA